MSLARKLLRTTAFAVAGAAALAGIAVGGFFWADKAFPLPLPEKLAVSTEVVDRDGALLRAFATTDGRWRLATGLDQIDRQFVEMLIAYEDKRFWGHRGIDPLALMRAAGQLVSNGRIVSGGSTISMQLARLIEPRSRSVAGCEAPPDLSSDPDRAASHQERDTRALSDAGPLWR